MSNHMAMAEDDDIKDTRIPGRSLTLGAGVPPAANHDSSNERDFQ